METELREAEERIALSTLDAFSTARVDTNVPSQKLGRIATAAYGPTHRSYESIFPANTSAETFKDLTNTTNTSEPKLLGLGLIDEVTALLGSLPLWKTVGEGEPLTLSIGVDVIQLVSLQWYFDGRPISGATRGTLIIPSVQSDQVGHYQLRATLLGITLLSIPTDVQINGTDGAVDHSSAAFDKLSDAKSALAAAKAMMAQAKSGSTAHGYSGTQIFSTLGSTKDLGEPNHCGISGGASEWYAWQPPTNGTAVITTDGSNFDTVLAVYIGPGDSYVTLTNVACDNNSGTNGKTSRVTFKASAGTIYYIAVDGVNGASGTVKLSYTIGSAPEIATQPASQTANPGQSAILSVTANSFPAPRYQWSFQGTNIAGATNASLTLANISNANFGTYQVMVTNAIGSVWSAPAEVIPARPLRFASQRIDTNGMCLSIQGPPGTNYVIECSATLSTWTPIFTNSTQNGLFSHVDAATKTNAHLFYRVRATP